MNIDTRIWNIFNWNKLDIQISVRWFNLEAAAAKTWLMAAGKTHMVTSAREFSPLLLKLIRIRRHDQASEMNYSLVSMDKSILVDLKKKD